MSSVSSIAMSESTFLTGPRPIVPPGPKPSVLDKHYDFLEWSPDGDVLLLGTSDLTSRTWAGSIWLFNSEESKSAESINGWKPDASQSLVGASMDCGVTAGKFLRCSDKFVVGCDSGALQVISVKKCTSNSYGESAGDMKFEGEGSMSEHNDMILDIDDLGSDGLHFVTCSQDKSIRIWDLESLVSTRAFSPAHAHVVTAVRACPLPGGIFASCARDGSALLWDTRDEPPATSLANPCGVGLTALSWVDDRTIVVGGVNGQLTVIDVRNTEQPKTVFDLEKRPLHSMRFIPNYSGLVAMCQDNSRITVMKFGSNVPEPVFTNDVHEDFVRGLSWNPKNHSLWSCGWDSKVFSHKGINI